MPDRTRAWQFAGAQGEVVSYRGSSSCDFAPGASQEPKNSDSNTSAGYDQEIVERVFERTRVLRRFSALHSARQLLWARPQPKLLRVGKCGGPVIFTQDLCQLLAL